MTTVSVTEYDESSDEFVLNIEKRIDAGTFAVFIDESDEPQEFVDNEYSLTEEALQELLVL